MTNAHYRLISSRNQAPEDGAADVRVAGDALVLVPSAGDALRVPFAQVESVGEAEPGTVRIVLADETAIELSRLGRMRTQLLAELRDGRADDAALAAAATGTAEVFAGMSGGDPAELRIYDDLLLVLPAAVSERISFSFISAVSVTGYVVAVEVAGREPVQLSGLGRRTGEFADLLAGRLADARGRTAAFLGALLPGLDPMALRQAAGLLRDGVAVSASALNQIRPGLADALIEIVTAQSRREAAAELGRRTDLAVGFKQIASVRRPAVGGAGPAARAVAPRIGQQASPGGSFPPGVLGMAAAGMLAGGTMAGGTMAGGLPLGFDDGYSFYGGYWGFRALGAVIDPAQQRPMTPRPDVSRGRLTPATEDLPALVATGEEPTVLAFVLGRAGDRVVYEVLNRPEPVTFVYQAAGADGLTAINRALDDSGFRPAAGHAGGPDSVARPTGWARLLAESLAGQVAHDTGWLSEITALLPG
jgi:hypothetical protein